jgi:hypothetical protein
VAPGMQGAKQPYHFVENFELSKAEAFIGKCRADSERLALSAIEALAGELRERGYRVVGSAVLLASGRELPALSNILDSHALIHAAEGEFFRAVFREAFERLDITVTGFRERDLEECARKTFGRAAIRLREQISGLGRLIGPPWTQDQKAAALGAALVLANK